MKRDTFQLEYNTETGMSYVFKAKDEKQKNHKECNSPIITGYMPQLLDENGYPHKLCPVRSFENYTFSLNEDMEYLWQTANDAAYNRGDPKWLKKSRVGESKLGVFMQEISALCELSRKYTNHSVRVTGATNLSRAAFSASQIMSITGHKSVNSLAMYQRVKSDEKMMMGMSLAFNLFRPQEVTNALESSQENAPQTTAVVIAPKKRKILPKSPPEATAPNPNVLCPGYSTNQAQIVYQPSTSAMSTTSPAKPEIQSPQPYFDLLQAQCSDSEEDTNTNFDLMKLINEVSDDDLMIAATQMEKEYESTTAHEKSKTTIMKKSQQIKAPRSQDNTTFTGCKIANIHFHIHKS